MVSARLIHDALASGAWNMAVDAALLESAAAGGTPCLRFYGWSPPTLSLGFFQQHAQRHQHRQSSDLAVVRRSTGGGAIVHDRELTYSLLLPYKTRFSAAGTALVAEIHRSLTHALADWNVAARLHGEPAESPSADKPFLCFQRRTAQDVILSDHKICGSALRQRRSATLVHGSVLLATSPHASVLPGIAELAGQSVLPTELAAAWTQELGAALGFSYQPSCLTPSESIRAGELERQYGGAEWTQRR